MSKELSIKLLLDDKEALSKLNKALKSIDDDSRRSVDSMNLSWAGFASKLFCCRKGSPARHSFHDGRGEGLHRSRRRGKAPQ